MKAYAILGWIGFIITCVVFVLDVVMSRQYHHANLLLILAPIICYFANKYKFYWISIVMALFLVGGFFNTLLGYLHRLF